MQEAPPPRPRPQRRRTLALLLCVALLGATACSDDRPKDTTLEAAAKVYADATLHGSAADINRLRSASCLRGATEATLTKLRAGIVAASGHALEELKVESVEIRNTSAASGEARVHIASEPPPTEADWLAFVAEAGQWRAADCDHLPYGGTTN